MKSGFLILIYFAATIHVFGQDSLKIRRDSLTQLAEVVVHGYANDRPLSEIPASVVLIKSDQLERFNNTSLLPAVNTIPGVRMEERSPGSYRFAIRGSSLRSPFGVRNVKMYLNGLPLTDGGGNTYLNLLDYNSIGSVEVIKGPGASLYGAGTGGVVLLNSPASGQRQTQLSVVGGGFGLRRYQFGQQVGNDRTNAQLQYSHQQSDGFRQQTAMRRDAVNILLRHRLFEKGTLVATLFYTDLYYQTPGGLTLAQFNANPRQARPTTGAGPGAVDQQAAVNNKSGYGSMMYEHQWSSKWNTKVGIYGSVTDFVNPTINNYERRKEYNWGSRIEAQYLLDGGAWKGKMTVGGEYQHFYSTLADYDNNRGKQGNVQTDDRLYSNFMMIFGQAEWDLPRNIFVTVGVSGNFLKYKLDRISTNPHVVQERNFSPVLSPRVAILKKLGDRVSLFGNVSKGFSPPTLAEVRPSTATFNNGLNPEQGISYEAGLRGTLLKKIFWDVAVYDFELNETIVVQQQINGQDFFINAGNTSQKGFENMLSWSPDLQSGMLSALKIWSSYTVNKYRFVHYKKAVDYSGHQLTGVPRNVWVGGIDVSFARHFYLNLTLNYVDKIPVNDANSQYSSAYVITGLRLGYQQPIKSLRFELFGGVDNAGNRIYSLGNDLNAFRDRYYNAAAGRNFYFGLKIRAGK